MGAAYPKADRHGGRGASSGAAHFVARLVFLLIGASWLTETQAQGVAVHLIDISQGSELTDTVNMLASDQSDGDGMSGGYELSDGTWVSFAKWYHTDWPDTHLDMLTQIGDDFGVLWGFGTGETGEKYTIDPSLRLGFVAQAHPSPSSLLSLTMRGIFWGELTEQTCEADYGEIGGVQTVNCRLAATFLPPAETLQYLTDAEPNRLHVSLTYSASF